MPTQCFIVERDADGLFTLPGGAKAQTHELPAGAMWRCTCHEEQGWLIQLPNHAGPWCTLEPASGTKQLWNVSGEPPNLSVTPSINATWGTPPNERGWHGWITNGIMDP